MKGFAPKRWGCRSELPDLASMLRDAALGACIALRAVVLSGDEPVCVVGVELV